MSTNARTLTMKVGDHYCGIYRSDEEQRALVIGFVQGGIANGEKMVYIVNVQTAAQLRETLIDAGIDVDPLLERGQLVILTAKEGYLHDGAFDPDRMIELLRAKTAEALAEGYPAMRCTGEMTWALAGEPGSERLIEYESKLNAFITSSKCYGYCQYDRRRFSDELIQDVLQTHPEVLHGQEAFDNRDMYFIPPDQFLGGDRPTAVIDRWLANLENHPKA